MSKDWDTAGFPADARSLVKSNLAFFPSRVVGTDTRALTPNRLKFPLINQYCTGPRLSDFFNSVTELADISPESAERTL